MNHDTLPFEIDVDDFKSLGHSNKVLSDVIFKLIKDSGYTSYDIQHIDGYIVEGPPNSITHFKLHEVWNSWKFGLWVNSKYLVKEEIDDNFPIVSLFCQHIHLIDKFKPSASNLVVEFNKKDILNYFELNNSMFMQYEIENLLNHIKRHPLIAYYGRTWKYLDGSPLKYFLNCELAEIKFNVKEKLYVKVFNKYAKFTIKKFEASKLVDHVTYRGLSTEWISNPRLSVVVWFKENANDEDIDKLVSKVLCYKFIQKLEFGKLDKYVYTLRYVFIKGDEYISYE